MAGEPLRWPLKMLMTGFKLSLSMLHAYRRNVAHHRAVTVTSFGKAFRFLHHHEEMIAFRDRKGVLHPRH
jgi:hypothetical protein